MRTTPTLSVSSNGDWKVEGDNYAPTVTGIGLDQASPKIAATNFNASVASGEGSHIIGNNTTAARFNLSAEL